MPKEWWHEKETGSKVAQAAVYWKRKTRTGFRNIAANRIAGYLLRAWCINPHGEKQSLTHAALHLGTWERGGISNERQNFLTFQILNPQLFTNHWNQWKLQCGPRSTSDCCSSSSIATSKQARDRFSNYTTFVTVFAPVTTDFTKKMLPATERPKSARSFTNQFLKERKRKRDLFLFGMNRNESPSQRNKCDNTTAKRRKYSSSGKTDENMYNVHRSNHRAKPKRVRDARERSLTCTSWAASTRARRRRKQQERASASRSSFQRIREQMRALEICRQGMRKRDRQATEFWRERMRLTLYRAWLHGLELGIYVCYLCTYYTNSIVP